MASIGLHMLGRSHEIEDFVQDVFLDAARGLRGLRHPAAVKSWLATIAVRLARRRLRARRLRALLGLDRAYDYAEVADSAASPADRVLLVSVYRLLERLPASERIPWSLRTLEGERLERVARLCGCSLATAKRRIAADDRSIREAMRHD